MLARNAVLDSLPEFCTRLQPERLGEGLIGRHRSRCFDGLGGDHELGGFAGKLLLHVMLRKSNLQCPGLTADDTDKVILKTGDEVIRANEDNRIVAGATLERRAIDRARKRNRDTVILGSLLALRARCIWPVLLDDASDALLHLGVGDIGREPRELDTL